MPTLFNLLTLLLCGLLAATPVAAAPVAVGGPDAEAAEPAGTEAVTPARAIHPTPAAAGRPAVQTPSAAVRLTAPAVNPRPVRTHLLLCVWRE